MDHDTRSVLQIVDSFTRYNLIRVEPTYNESLG